MKRILNGLFVLAVIASMISLFSCGEVSNPDYTSIEYRNTESVFEEFPFISDAESVIWKSGVIGSAAPGPNSFEYKVFAVIPKDLRSDFESRCSSDSCEVEFDDGIDPADTGFSDFNWRKSSALESELYAAGYAGSVYYDSVNGIVYIDAATM